MNLERTLRWAAAAALACLAAVTALGAAGSTNYTSFPNIRLGGTTNLISDNGTHLTRNGAALISAVAGTVVNTNVSSGLLSVTAFTNGVAATKANVEAAVGGTVSTNWTDNGTDSTLAGTATANSGTFTNGVTSKSYDITLLALGDMNTNHVVDFSLLCSRTGTLTNDTWISVTNMPASVERLLTYRLYTGTTNRNVYWQTGLSNAIGSPLQAVLLSNIVYKFTFDSWGTGVTNVDVYSASRIP